MALSALRASMRASSAGLDLVAHVDLAGRVLSDQDDGQAGADAPLGQNRGVARDFGAQLARQRNAVNALGGR
jgi:hypothetical protein